MTDEDRIAYLETQVKNLADAVCYTTDALKIVIKSEKDTRETMREVLEVLVETTALVQRLAEKIDRR